MLELTGKLPPASPSMPAAPVTGSVFTPVVIWLAIGAAVENVVMVEVPGRMLTSVREYAIPKDLAAS